MTTERCCALWTKVPRSELRERKRAKVRQFPISVNPGYGKCVIPDLSVFL